MVLYRHGRPGQLGETDQARLKRYDRAVQWMEDTTTKRRKNSRRLRAEAAAVLGVKVQLK